MTNRFQFASETPAPLAGNLLVASRGLEGTPFARTVVLILQENSDGVFGVVLNRDADPKMIAAFRETSQSPEHVASHIACGGPLGGPVFAVHHDNLLGELKIADGLFVTSNVEGLERLFADEDRVYRVFLGVAGWKRDQLDKEIGRGLWYLVEQGAEDVVASPDHLWERSLIRYGNQQLTQLLQIPIVPQFTIWN